jgi:hypothetical protein
VGAVVDAAVCLGEFGATELAFIIELDKLFICLFIYLLTYYETIIIIYTYIKNKVYYYYSMVSIKGGSKETKGRVKGDKRKGQRRQKEGSKGNHGSP